MTTQPSSIGTDTNFEDPNAKLDSLLSRINTIAEGGGETIPDSNSPTTVPSNPISQDCFDFAPVAPKTFKEAGISDTVVEELICKFLLAIGEATGRQITDQVKLPFHLVEQVLNRLKHEQLIGYVGQATMNDYICKLTDAGRERGKRFNDFSTYFGSAPVTLEDYIASVEAQTLQEQEPGPEDLQEAFSDLLINEKMFSKLGPAVNSGRGMFLYGFPGNGKTSIAERVTASFGKYIYIPRALMVDRDIIRLFDPMNHVQAPDESNGGLLSEQNVDQRWIRIERPTIVVGGELTMDHLEIRYNPTTGISEAPLQMKSNCGTLVIDDFGRQRMSVDELLNRWIVPLEKRYDFLNTSSGKKIRVPFDQLVIFSTNLEPKDLVDDAFLRRIPYKIEVENPSVQEFCELFKIMCRVMKFEFKAEPLMHLIENHYKPNNRPFRNCHPRDILLQIKNYSKYHKKPMELTNEAMDFACENYFSVM
jgi:predicted ATPase with chaperone activity